MERQVQNKLQGSSEGFREMRKSELNLKDEQEFPNRPKNGKARREKVLSFEKNFRNQKT